MRSAEHRQGLLDLLKHGSLQTDREDDLVPCVQQTHSTAGCDQEICSDAQQKQDLHILFSFFSQGSVPDVRS